MENAASGRSCWPQRRAIMCAVWRMQAKDPGVRGRRHPGARVRPARALAALHAGRPAPVVLRTGTISHEPTGGLRGRGRVPHKRATMKRRCCRHPVICAQTGAAEMRRSRSGFVPVRLRAGIRQLGAFEEERVDRGRRWEDAGLVCRSSGSWTAVLSHSLSVMPSRRARRTNGARSSSGITNSTVAVVSSALSAGVRA